MKASSVGGRELSFGEDVVLLPVLIFHIFSLHSVINIHASTTFPYVAHMNFVAWARTVSILALVSPILVSGQLPFLAIFNAVPLPIPCNDATVSGPDKP